MMSHGFEKVVFFQMRPLTFVLCMFVNPKSCIILLSVSWVIPVTHHMFYDSE